MKKLIPIILACVVLIVCAALILPAVLSGNETDTGKSDKPSNQETVPEKNKITLPETVIMDTDDYLIKVIGAEYDEIGEFSLKVYTENRSSDKTYEFYANDILVNNIHVFELFYKTVTPGKKANDEISISDYLFNYTDIGDYTDIQITFEVLDCATYDVVDTKTVHLYPYGEDKATNFVREPQVSDEIIMDNEYVTVTVTGYEQTDLGYFVWLFIESKTNMPVNVSIDNTSVNGYMFSSYVDTEIFAGACTFEFMEFFKNTLDDNDISKIKEIEFTLRVYMEEDFFFDKTLAEETIILNP